MKLTPEAHKLAQDYFRHFFEDENLKLPQIQIYSRRGAKLVTRILSVHGITIGKHIFIAPSQTCRDSEDRLCLSKSLLIHEATHTLQYKKLGFTRFLYRYFKSYFVILREKKKWDLYSRMDAYLEIPYEVEARKTASEFADWYYSRKT